MLTVIAIERVGLGRRRVFSVVVFFVLLLGTLVSPALSGNAINGERDAGTLATTQVTLITTAQLVIGKWLAAWLTALAFLAASVPFLVFGIVLGQISAATIVISVLVLAVELGVIAADRRRPLGPAHPPALLGRRDLPRRRRALGSARSSPSASVARRSSRP